MACIATMSNERNLFTLVRGCTSNFYDGASSWPCAPQDTEEGNHSDEGLSTSAVIRATANRMRPTNRKIATPYRWSCYRLVHAPNRSTNSYSATKSTSTALHDDGHRRHAIHDQAVDWPVARCRIFINNHEVFGGQHVPKRTDEVSPRVPA